MDVFKEGDKSKGPCYDCQKLVVLVFRFADYKINKRIILHDILQGFCDECGNVVSIPHQSSMVIRKKREKHERENK